MSNPKASIEIFGNAGEITVDPETGLVLHYEKNEAECRAIAKHAGFTDRGYADIVRFDVEEWKRFYVGEEIIGGDILDWGYWLANGTYAQPEHTWRKSFVEERDAERQEEARRVLMSCGSGI